MNGARFLGITVLIAGSVGCGSGMAFDDAIDSRAGGPRGSGVDPAGSNDRYVEVLTRMGFPRQDIVERDGSFVIQKDMVFDKSLLDHLLSLKIPTQTRFDNPVNNWNTVSLDQSALIKVYIESTGNNRVGANWAAGVRAAMAKWNALTGTNVKFVETTSSTARHIRVKTLPTISGAMAATNWTYETAIFRDVDLNGGYEADWTNPYGPCDVQRRAAVAHEFGHVLNIGHTNELGLNDQIQITGTPSSDTLSLWDEGVIPHNLEFSTNDVKAIRYLYPAGAVLAVNTYGLLMAEGPDPASGVPPKMLLGQVSSFQQDGDRIVALQGNGDLWGKDEVDAPWVLLKSNVKKFKIAGNRIGCIDGSDVFWVKNGLTGTWVKQCQIPIGSTCAERAVKIDLDPYGAGRIAYLNNTGNLRVKETTSLSSTSWTNYGSGNNIVDFQLEGSRIVHVLNGGYVRGKDGALNGSTWTDLYSGPIQNFQLEGDRIGLLLADGTFLAKDGLSGAWVTEATSVKKFDMSGNRIGALLTDDTLYVKQGLSGAWNLVHSSTWKFKLTEYYTTIIDYSFNVKSKYDTSDWQQYSPYSSFFGQD